MYRLLKRLWPRRRQSHAEAVVLMFHRVAEPPIDPFGLTVTPHTFDQALEALRLETKILSPHEFVEMTTGAYPPGRYSLITFDDGYEDVVTNALPILRKRGLGAVLFVPSRILKDSTPFWWDILAELILDSPQLPEQLQFDSDGRVHKWKVAAESRTLSSSEAAFLAKWNCWSQTQNASPRARLLLEIWKKFQTLPASHWDNSILSLCNQVGLDPIALQTSRLASVDQLMAFAQTDKCAVGAHTINHVQLKDLADAQQKQEIVGSKEELTKVFGAEVDSFSYPHGSYTERTTKLVQDAGYRIAFSTIGGRVDSGVTNPLTIPRLYIDSGSVAGLRSTIRDLFAEKDF